MPRLGELASAGEERYARGRDLQIDPTVPAYLVSLLAESETSGGLLFSVAPERARAVADAFRRRGEECWEIGEVLREAVIRVTA